MEKENVKRLAKKFLDVADRLNEGVSRYLNGSPAQEDENDYCTVKRAEREFIDAANALYDGRWECCLNYELAESFL